MVNTTATSTVTMATSSVSEGLYQEEEWSDPLESIRGICSNITSGIHVDIMYAISGKANGIPINEIVGAKIR